jgi:hypothetical protein
VWRVCLSHANLRGSITSLRGSIKLFREIHSKSRANFEQIRQKFLSDTLLVILTNIINLSLPHNCSFGIACLCTFHTILKKDPCGKL